MKMLQLLRLDVELWFREAAPEKCDDLVCFGVQNRLVLVDHHLSSINVIGGVVGLV